MKVRKLKGLLLTFLVLFNLGGTNGFIPFVTASADTTSIEKKKSIIENFFGDDENPCAVAIPGKDKTDSTNTDGAATSGGSWKQPGSKANKNAQAMWDDWKSHGGSGAFISGVLGNVLSEGGLEMPDRPQGYYGNEPAKGLAQGGFEPIGGGGGPYQLTPYHKFAPKGDKRWLDIGAQTDFVWNSEIKNGVQSLSLGKISAEKMLSEKDVAQATFNWANGYERGQGMSSINTPEMRKRIALAKEAYVFFDGDKVAGDSSLINGAGTGADKTTADTSYASESNPCGNQSNSDEEYPDGVGTHTTGIGSAFKNYDELPADMKKYAHDPADLLGPRGQGNKWIALGVSDASYDQCVGFSVAYGNALWGLTGNRTGNGIDTAESFAKDLHIDTSKTPRAGAIFSQNEATPAGHTGVVMHVYANGDMLITEQNMRGKSGAAAGEKFTWDFRLVSKDQFQHNNTYYVYPKDAGKKLNWK